MAGCLNVLPKSPWEWQSNSALCPSWRTLSVHLQAVKQGNDQKVMLSASSPFLCLPLTKTELGKIPPNFAGGAQCGAGSC